jgi:hypothetical protein
VQLISVFTICRAAEPSRLLLIWPHILRTPSDPHLSELIAMLDRCPEVLSIFNHPLWDLGCLGDTEKILDQLCDLM